MFSRTVLAVLALAVSGVQSDTCSFVSPSPPSNQGDSTYGLGEAFDISWSWDMEAGDLIIYQDYPPLKGGSYLFKRLDSMCSLYGPRLPLFFFYYANGIAKEKTI